MNFAFYFYFLEKDSVMSVAFHKRHDLGSEVNQPAGRAKVKTSSKSAFPLAGGSFSKFPGLFLQKPLVNKAAGRAKSKIQNKSAFPLAGGSFSKIPGLFLLETVG